MRVVSSQAGQQTLSGVGELLMRTLGLVDHNGVLANQAVRGHETY